MFKVQTQRVTDSLSAEGSPSEPLLKALVSAIECVSPPRQSPKSHSSHQRAFLAALSSPSIASASFPRIGLDAESDYRRIPVGGPIGHESAARFGRTKRYRQRASTKQVDVRDDTKQ